MMKGRQALLSSSIDELSLNSTYINNGMNSISHIDPPLSTNKPRKGPRKSTHSSPTANGRVKVGIRCRPAFQEEIDFAQGNFFSIVDCYARRNDGSTDDTNDKYDRVSLTLLSGKQRDFYYDYAFDANVTQDEVYDKVACPVVNDVIRGLNGTIFCYGQTGEKRR